MMEKKTYLGYYESLEASGFKLFNSLKEAKKPWCFNMRIFEVPGLTQKELNSIEKPRYPKIKKKYKLIYSEGNLFHELVVDMMMRKPTKEETDGLFAETK